MVTNHRVRRPKAVTPSHSLPTKQKGQHPRALAFLLRRSEQPALGALLVERVRQRLFDLIRRNGGLIVVDNLVALATSLLVVT